MAKGQQRRDAVRNQQLWRIRKACQTVISQSGRKAHDVSLWLYIHGRASGEAYIHLSLECRRGADTPFLRGAVMLTYDQVWMRYLFWPIIENYSWTFTNMVQIRLNTKSKQGKESLVDGTIITILYIFNILMALKVLIVMVDVQFFSHCQWTDYKY